MPNTPHPTPVILAIETSCDDTACALLDGEGRVLSSIVSSQLAAHRPYGGVVPEIASRQHLESWPLVSSEALRQADLDLTNVDVVAATRGPGLVGSLLVGLSLGKSVAYALDRPFHAVHHLEGHLYSPFLATPGEGVPAAADPIPERFVGLVVSGGHTSLFGVDGERLTTYAETRDDAMGEVFDKVGKRLGLPYPQGPLVDRLAELGDAEAEFRLAVAACSDDSLDFSYSGLKSQTLGAVETLRRRGETVDLSDRVDDLPESAPQSVLDLLAAFRAAAVGQLIDRLDRLHRRQPFGVLAVSGGVAANRLLRREAATWCDARDVELRAVPLKYAGDNAAMIAHAALLRHRTGRVDDPFAAEASSRLAL